MADVTITPDTNFYYPYSTIQTYTITTTGEYQITAVGGDGGGNLVTYSDGDFGGWHGGIGATVVADFSLTAGDVIEVIPGSNGGGGNSAGGGGGGSFVYDETTGTLLEVAGGGGGAGVDGFGGPGQATTSGQAGTENGGAGGADGSGGSGSLGGGGGGYLSAGSDGAGFNGQGDPNRTVSSAGGGGGTSFVNSPFISVGSGIASADGGGGGFGGGGGGGTVGSDLLAGAGGGGGGYSGGGAGGVAGSGADYVGGGAGGGGGSYVDAGATNAVITAGGPSTLNDVNFNGGSVTFALVAACYLRGTRLATPRGPVAIEHLSAGDTVVTASGRVRPVVWTGRRRIDARAHPDPEKVWPFVVVAGAFGEALPSSDLWLSPGHNVVVGNALVPVSALANGRTIRQVRLPVFEYWHVELDAHDIVLAENLPSESYLDTGNRSAFENADAFLELHPDFRPRHWAKTCLPLVFDGAPVRRAKAALLRRAKAAGHAITDEDDLHVMADGQRIDAVPLGGKRRAFLLPAGAAALALHSRSFIPAHVNPASDDRRALGVCVGALQLDGVAIDLSNQRSFAEGWHRFEAPGDHLRQRWTKAQAPLPAGTRLIVIELAGRGYYWAPREESATALFG